MNAFMSGNSRCLVIVLSAFPSTTCHSETENSIGSKVRKQTADILRQYVPVCLALIGSTGDQRRGFAGSEIVSTEFVLCPWVEAHPIGFHRTQQF